VRIKIQTLAHSSSKDTPHCAEDFRFINLLDLMSVTLGYVPQRTIDHPKDIRISTLSVIVLCLVAVAIVMITKQGCTSRVTVRSHAKRVIIVQWVQL